MRVLVPALVLGLSVALPSCRRESAPVVRDWRDEVIYHVVQRSFFDSDGDRHGDLGGLAQKLPYLKELGATAILLLPVFESEFYHNYFPTDFERIDPEFGTMDDWLAFVREVHANGIRLIMDMETQYVATGHEWFDDSWKRPGSPYSGYLAWTDSLNEHAPGVFGVDAVDEGLPHWPDRRSAIVMMNLGAPEVREWTAGLFAFWADPDGDGDLSDGVDGFRVDHMMDDLDYQGRFTSLLAGFWKPVLDRARRVNPNLFVIGEQASWADYGEDAIARSGADAVFGFPVRFALSGTRIVPFVGERVPDGSRPLDPDTLAVRVAETLARIPGGAGFVTFIENHDTPRFASLVAGHEGMIRAAAVLNLTLPGIPSIYYGQELGLPGRQGDWGMDTNDIPIREAFPWTGDPDEPGTAVWYRDTGPWWDGSYFVSGAADSLSLSARRGDPASIWNLYRSLIALRKARAELRRGDYEPIRVGSRDLVAFSRSGAGSRSVIVINRSDAPLEVALPSLGATGYGAALGTPPSDAVLRLAPWAFSVLVSP